MKKTHDDDDMILNLDCVTLLLYCCQSILDFDFEIISFVSSCQV